MTTRHEIDQEIITESIADLRRLRAARLNDVQLQNNITTYRSAEEGTANHRWREDCVAELHRRRQSGA